MSFFRYPGGKSKLRNQIVDKLSKISKLSNLEYREPFFGGGSIGLKLLQDDLDLKSIWINDFDPGISCLWTTLINRPDLLKNKVQSFKPSVEEFYKLKKELTSEPPNFTSDVIIANFGFKKLAIHQISYSGLGTKSGGPLGGENQLSKYPIDCRWSPNYICKKIDILSEKFNRLKIRYQKCTNLDFEEVISNEENKAIIYLDPPYFVKGNDLYQCGFTENDHKRLANTLRKSKHQWVLSYDNCKEIHELYSWANIDFIDEINYSITALKDKETGERISRTKSELLISNNLFIKDNINVDSIKHVYSEVYQQPTDCASIV